MLPLEVKMPMGRRYLVGAPRVCPSAVNGLDPFLNTPLSGPSGLYLSISSSYAPIVLCQFCGSARLVLTLLFFKPCAAGVSHHPGSPRIHGPRGVIAPVLKLVVGAPTQRRGPDQAYPGGRGLHIA